MSIYWILALVPSLLIHLVLAFGLMALFIATFVGKIPFIRQYKLPIQILVLVLSATGIYLEGALGYKESVANEVAQLKTKLAQAEAQGAKVNTQIVEKVVKDTQIIRLKGKTVTEYVDREVVKHDQECKLPSEVIKAHNMAATLNANPSSGEGK